MNWRQRAALERQGVKAERYYLEGNYDYEERQTWATLPIWGLRLSRNGQTLCVIESTADDYKYDNPEFAGYHLRRTERGRSVAVFKLQRLAIAGAAMRGLLS